MTLRDGLKQGTIELSDSTKGMTDRKKSKVIPSFITEERSGIVEHVKKSG